MPRTDHCWDDVVSPLEQGLVAATRPGRREGVGPRPALLVIDLFEKAFAGGSVPVREANRQFPGSCGENACRTLDPMLRLFAAARAARIPIIYTTATPPTDQRVLATNRKSRQTAIEGYRIRAEFSPQPGDLIIPKERASGLFGTRLLAHLQLLGVRGLIMCGQSTSGCVRATTVDGAMYGFDMTVVEDCCFDRSMLSHKIALWDLHRLYAEVSHVEDVVGDLERLSRS